MLETVEATVVARSIVDRILDEVVSSAVLVPDTPGDPLTGESISVRREHSAGFGSSAGLGSYTDLGSSAGFGSSAGLGLSAGLESSADLG